MPGAYAHIAVVNDAQKRAGSAGLRDKTAAALGRFLKFAELGAVSPDYPYLAAMHPAQKKWADAMHYTRTGTLLRSGAAHITRLPASTKPKATAWFLGLAAHMTTDMTIHPVVELRVGPYKGNESEHRRCEMHQDAFIFPRVLDLGDTGLSQHLATGIASCHAPDDEDEIDPVIGQVWSQMLTETYPEELQQEGPRPSVWHCGFRNVLQTLAKASHLFPFARHVSSDLNIGYPVATDIHSSYVTQLRTPEGPMDYHEIYARARANVLAVWKGLDEALLTGRSEALDQLEDWNLDTGRSVQTGRLVFWKEPA